MPCIPFLMHKSGISGSVSKNSTNLLFLFCNYCRILFGESGVFYQNLTYKEKSGMLCYVVFMHMP